jgi:hypothetical protein
MHAMILSHHCQICSLAKIVPTTSVPTFIKPKASTQVVSSNQRWEDIQITHLPSHLQLKFNTHFTPCLIETFGYTLPWEQPTDDEFIALWAQVFPQEPALDFNIRLGAIIKKLVCMSWPLLCGCSWKSQIDDQLAVWRNKFGLSGLAMLCQVHFLLLPNNSRESHAEWCAWAISHTDFDQPFYYHEYEEKEGKTKSSVSTMQSRFEYSTWSDSIHLGGHFSTTPYRLHPQDPHIKHLCHQPTLVFREEAHRCISP